MASSFFQLTLKSVPAEQEDFISSFCFDWNASGVAEDLAFQQTQLEYQPEVLERDLMTLNVYFEEFPGESFIEALKSQFPDIKFDFTEEQNRDWLAEWKKSFQPFRMSGPYWIVPSWCETPPEAERPIFIDPGMAFGTGTHATTQTASHLLVGLEGKLGSVIDVGTGTGVLAMLAHSLGGHPVCGTDIDPQAREVARENLEKNQLSQIEIFEVQIDAIQEQFDTVVANIVDGVLLKLKPDLLRILKPHGQMVLSGILVEREELFTQGFLENTSLEIVKRVEQDEWVSLLLRVK